MNKCRSMALAILALAILAAPVTFAESGNFGPVLKLVPKDAAFVAVIADLEALDLAVMKIQKQMDPSGSPESIVEEIKDELPVRDWCDFSKPIAIAMMDSDSDSPVVWVYVEGFATKAKAQQGTKTGDTWSIVMGGANIYAKEAGKYIVASDSMENLAKVDMKGGDLSGLMSSSNDFIKGRDMLLHVNFDRYRSLVLGQIAQIAPMVPMMAMMQAQQSGQDPTMLTGMFTGAVGGVEDLAKQLEYADLALAVGTEYVDATIATTYKPGRIENHLKKAGPASVDLLGELPDQPYVLATSMHLPGGMNEIADYICDKMFATAAATNPDAGKALTISKQIAALTEGGSMIMQMASSGMKVRSTTLTSNPARLAELTKESLTSSASLMKAFQGGVNYKSLGAQNFGKAAVEMFSMEMAPPAPGMPAAPQPFDLDNTFMGMGVLGKKVMSVLGTKPEIEAAFTNPVKKTMAGNAMAKAALQALPARKNAIVLLDLVSVMPILQAQMMGMPAAPSTVSGAPIAISVTLCEEPVRLDIRIPVQSVVKVSQMANPGMPQ